MKTIKHCRVHVTRTALAETGTPYAKIVTSSRDVHALAASIVAGEDQEVLLVFYLDARNRVCGYTEVSRGTVNFCPVHLRDVFRGAVLQGSTSIIVVHNHPSGDPSPSDEDRVLTRQLVKAGKLLDIPVLDHIVVGSDRYYSFLDRGRLQDGVA
jgi:DNA repair protein RadC